MVLLRMVTLLIFDLNLKSIGNDAMVRSLPLEAVASVEKEGDAARVTYRIANLRFAVDGVLNLQARIGTDRDELGGKIKLFGAYVRLVHFVALREEGVLVLEKAQKADAASLLADTKVRLTLALTGVLDSAKLVVQEILCGQ